MEKIREIIDSLEYKVKELLKKTEGLKNDNHQLRLKLKYSESIIDNQQEKINQLNNDLEAIKITNSLLGSEDFKKETRNKINTLIKEIDYCIEQLSE